MRSTIPLSEIFKSCLTQGSRTIFGHPQIDQSSVCQPCENWLSKGHRPPTGGPSLTLGSLGILYIPKVLEPIKVLNTSLTRSTIPQSEIFKWSHT